MNNSYKKAMDKIELSCKLKEKIINNTSNQKNQNSKSGYVSIQKIAELAACFIFCFLSYHTVTNYYMQTPANIVSVDTSKPSTNNEISNKKVTENESVQDVPVPNSKTNSVINNTESASTNPPTYENQKMTDNPLGTNSLKQEAAIEYNSPADNELPHFTKNTEVIKNNNSSVSEQLTDPISNVSLQDKSALKATDNDKTYNVSGKNDESAITSSPSYEKTTETDNQIETNSSTPEVTIEDDSPAADNGLSPFAKGKVNPENNNDNSVSEPLTMEQPVTTIKSPQKVPVGYEVSNISVVEGTVSEIIYQSVNDTITYRTAKSSEDLSEKNDTYEFMEIVNIDNTDIVLKGNKELYHNAVWCNNKESFSITSDNGIKKSIMVDMVLSVDYADN